MNQKKKSGKNQLHLNTEDGIPGTRQDEIRHIILATLISADYEGISEDEKQGIIDHFNEDKTLNWRYILGPIKDAKKREKFIELLEYEPPSSDSLRQKSIDYTRGYAAKAGV